MKMSIRARGAVLVLCALAVCARKGTAERRSSPPTPDPEKIIGIAGRGYAGVGLDSRASKRWGIVDAGVGLVLNLGSTQNSALFGPARLRERFTNRVATFFFSELLRFNMTETVERIDAGGRRASLELTTTESEFARAPCSIERAFGRSLWRRSR